MWFYFIWIPLATVVYCFYAWLSVKSNTYQGYWTLGLFFAGVLGPWPIVARYSKNIVFDGLLYDILIFLTYTCAAMFIANQKFFNLIQIIGIAVIVAGLLVVKLGGKL